MTFDQMGLFAPTSDAPTQIDGRRLSIAERFEIFHAANPHVYRALARLARTLTARGHRVLGMKMLFEVLRYQSMIVTVDTDGAGFKLNNDFTANYARALMDNEPDLAGCFRLRHCESDGCETFTQGLESTRL